MNAHSSNPHLSNGSERQQWDGVAAGWARWWQTIERGAHRVSQRMVELAELAPGQQVLDIATGIGEPALLAATRVGPTGHVVATDLSAEMLAFARQRAMGLGLTNVAFLEGDASQLPFPPNHFDAILCRWGVTALPRYGELLTVIRGMLRPKGAFVTAVWEEGPQSRPLATLAAAVVQEIMDAPPGGPGPASGDEPVRAALRTEMLQAGFGHIHMENAALTLEFASADECTQYLRDVSPDIASALSRMSPAQQGRFKQRLAQRLEPFLRPDGGVLISNVTLCVLGRP